MEEYDFPGLNSETIETWNQNAKYWDEKMGEGNNFHNTLIEPVQLSLLELKPDHTVLDIGCGNGQFARRMGMEGATVTAFDASEVMIEQAKARTSGGTGRVEYIVMDATDKERLMSLGGGQFDAAVCTMALMDISSIGPLILSLSHLLKLGGRFVFSICHPCFNNPVNKMVVEKRECGKNITEEFGIKVAKYISPGAEKGLAMVGQPMAQYYFNRPISVLFNTCFNSGFILDRIEEPAFPKGCIDPTWYAWENFQEIPPVLVARMYLQKRTSSGKEAGKSLKYGNAL